MLVRSALLAGRAIDFGGSGGQFGLVGSVHAALLVMEIVCAAAFDIDRAHSRISPGYPNGSAKMIPAAFSFPS
jgi:hypothetical protein